MLNPAKIEQLAKQITEALPPGVKAFADEFEQRVKQLLQAKLQQLDFVSREEFEVQKQVLLKTRQQLEQLQQQLDKLQQDSSEETPQ